MQNQHIEILKKNQQFFKEYEPKFVELFIKTANKNVISEKEIKIIYKVLFLKPFILKNKQIPIILEIEEKLNNYNIPLHSILEKLFFFITNAFIKYLLINQSSYFELKEFVNICNFYLQYFKKHKSTSTPLPKEIYDIFSNKEKINLFNAYKGIPLSYKTSILSINNNDIIVNTSINFIFASKFNREIYFNQENKNYYFIGEVKNFDKEKKIISITNIKKIQRTIPKREHIRVQPKEEIEVSVINEKNNIQAKLFDISLQGMAIILNNNYFEISERVETMFTIEIENIKYLLNIIGEIRSITKIDENTYKYHIYFEPNSKDEKILEKYIVNREKEIINELHKLIENQFFLLE